MAFSKLLQLNTEDVTPDRASAVFLAEIKRLVREDGLSLSAAWRQLKLAEPDLADRATQQTSAAALTNDDTAPARPMLMGLLSQKPFITSALHLPGNVDNDVLNAAFIANGSQFVNVDSRKVFLAVQTQLMKTNGLNAADTHRVMQDDYPALCRHAKQTP